LSDLIFDREVDPGEQKEWAGKLLVDSIKFHQNEKYAWIIERLNSDKFFSKEATKTSGKFKADYPRIFMKTLVILCTEDNNYTMSLIEKNFSNEEIKTMAKQWWLKSIGRDLEWARHPEMLLVSLKFQKHIVILSNTVEGPKVDTTYSTIESMRSDISDLVRIPGTTTVIYVV
jgi:hypothetical protein